MELLFFLFILHLNKIHPHLKIPVLDWTGRHSLLIFAIHRLLFLKFLAPLRVLIGTHLGVPMTNTAWEVCLLYLPLTIFLAFCIWKTQVHRLIIQPK